MKNKYEIRGDYTVLFLTYKGQETTTLISTEDLPKISSFAGRWYAMNVGGAKSEKIYVGTIVGGVTVYLHQIIAMNPPQTVVDHANHNPLDNRRENLRIATFAENAQNRKGCQRNNVNSGYRNVYRTKNGNWAVRLMKEGRSIYVGTYQDVEEANRKAIEARQYYYEGISK